MRWAEEVRADGIHEEEAWQWYAMLGQKSLFLGAVLVGGLHE